MEHMAAVQAQAIGQGVAETLVAAQFPFKTVTVPAYMFSMWSTGTFSKRCPQRKRRYLVPGKNQPQAKQFSSKGNFHRQPSKRFHQSVSWLHAMTEIYKPMLLTIVEIQEALASTTGHMALNFNNSFQDYQQQFRKVLSWNW